MLINEEHNTVIKKLRPILKIETIKKNLAISKVLITGNCLREFI